MKKKKLKKSYNMLNYGLCPKDLPRKKKKQEKKKALIWCKENYKLTQQLLFKTCDCEPHTFYEWEKEENKCYQCNKPIIKQTNC